MSEDDEITLDPISMRASVRKGLMHILSTNTHILLHMVNFIIINRMIFFINHGVNLQLKHFKNGTAKVNGE